MKINLEDWRACQLTGKDHPLYTAPWQPSLYSKGMHTLEIRAIDSSGATSETLINFSLDGTTAPYPVLARLALMLDLTNVVKTIF